MTAARRFWGLVLLLGGLAGAARAESATVVLGAGDTLCGAWISGIEKPEHLGQFEWVLGSVSRGAYTRDGHVLATRTPAEVESWMNSYCRTHALDTLQSAAYNLELDMKWQAKKNAMLSDDPIAPPH